MSGCYTCRSDASDAPRDAVVASPLWRAAVCFNSTLPGWLVLVPRRHVLTLADLTADEAAELGPLVRDLSIALAEVTGCTKTYVMQFAEAEGFGHVHVHLVPRMPDLPADARGPGVFRYLTDDESRWLPGADRDALALRVRAVVDGGSRGATT